MISESDRHEFNQMLKQNFDGVVAQFNTIEERLSILEKAIIFLKDKLFLLEKKIGKRLK